MYLSNKNEHLAGVLDDFCEKVMELNGEEQMEDPGAKSTSMAFLYQQNTFLEE